MKNLPILLKLIFSFMLSTLFLSACSSSGIGIKNIEIEIDEEFMGTMGTLPYEPVYLNWESSKLNENEKYHIKIDLPDAVGTGNDLEFDEVINNTDSQLKTDGSKNKLRLTVSWNEDSLFYFFAVAKSGAVASISIQKLDLNENILSEGKLEWTRPARLEKPADPILINYWTNDLDNYFRYNVFDVSILTFETFPTESNEKCIGICRPKSNSSARFPFRNEIWDWPVKSSGEKVILQRTVSNEMGTSKKANLEITSSAEYVYQSPSKSDPFIKEWSKKDKGEELLAKTVWCIENGFKNYIYSSDECTNTISR